MAMTDAELARLVLDTPIGQVIADLQRQLDASVAAASAASTEAQRQMAMAREIQQTQPGPFGLPFGEVALDIRRAHAALLADGKAVADLGAWLGRIEGQLTAAHATLRPADIRTALVRIAALAICAVENHDRAQEPAP